MEVGGEQLRAFQVVNRIEDGFSVFSNKQVLMLVDRRARVVAVDGKDECVCAKWFVRK